MSAALRQFADYVQSEPLQLARLSIHEAVEKAGVSVATANRFATAIGFAGYAEFRSELIKGFEALFVPAERLKQKLAEGASPRDVMVASLREDIANLEATIANLTGPQTDKAVEMIVNAERIYIAGFENAGSLANILADHLNSPLSAMSRLSLYVEAHHEFNPPSDTAILGLIEALVAAVASKTPNAAEVVEKFAAYTYPWMISSPSDWTSD
jgi:DNA-binding MurR/RpiR family transcriptional regulator